MKKLSTFAALAAAVVSMFAVVGSAEAANWNASVPAGLFDGAGGSAAIKVQGKTTSCTASTLSGSVTALTGPPFTSPWPAVAFVRLAFTGCTNAGINYVVTCKAANFDAKASGYNSGVTTTEAASAGNFTEGWLSAILCTIKPAASPSNNCTTFTGTVPATYLNPATLAPGLGAANKGSLTIGIAGQSLTAVSVGGCAASIGNGSATFGVVSYSVSGSPNGAIPAPHIWAN
jgi:hypothetical protein